MGMQRHLGTLYPQAIRLFTRLVIEGFEVELISPHAVGSMIVQGPVVFVNAESRVILQELGFIKGGLVEICKRDNNYGVWLPPVDVVGDDLQLRRVDNSRRVPRLGSNNVDIAHAFSSHRNCPTRCHVLQDMVPRDGAVAA